MTTLPAVVRIIDLPVATTVTGGELVEAIQTVGGTSISVQMPISSIMSTGFGALPTGGATGQFLAKLSATNYSATWSSVVSFVAVNTASGALATSGSVTSIVINVASGGIGSTQLAASAVQASNVTTNAIGNSQFRQGTGLSVVGVAGNATANVADIVGSAPLQVLQVNAGGTGLAFTTLAVGSSFLGITNTGLFNQFGTTLATGTFGIVGTTLVTGIFGVVGTSNFTGVHNVVGTTLITGVFGQVGTSLMTGLFQVVGTSAFTGVHSVNGTTLFTSGAFGVVGTALFTGTFTQVGTSTMTGTNNLNGPLNVIGTSTFTGVHSVNGTTLFTAGAFGVVGTTLFTSGAFGVVGTTQFTGVFGIAGTTIITGSLGLSSLTAGVLVASATGVVRNQGGMVLLNTLSPNGVASVSDTTSLTSTYRNYMVMFDNVTPATNTTQLQMQVATSGTNFISANYLAYFGYDTAAGRAGPDTATTCIPLSGARATTSVQSSTLYGVSGFIKIFNPSGGVSRTQMVGESSYLGTGGTATSLFVGEMGGYYDGASNAITGINFLFSSGNIATGTIKIYGIT